MFSLINWLIRPHLGSSRIIRPGQKIHSSFLLSSKNEYTPKAHPLEDGDSFWKELRAAGLGSKMAHQWLELDLYEYTKTVVDNLVGNFITRRQSVTLETLHQIATSSKPGSIIPLSSIHKVGFR
jgi:hypothetical protein